MRLSPFPDDFEAAFDGEPGALGAAEAEAALALGRLDGALTHARPAAKRIFAGLVLGATLTSALRQEGHAFTYPRFEAWFAGLVPLTDTASRPARTPRILAEAVLAELAHSSWAPLAELARSLQPALLAPRDFAEEGAHADTHDAIAAARTLIADLGTETTPLPFASLSRLHAAIPDSTRFAPAERAPETITIGAIQMTVERAPPPSPRWAIELVYGEHLRATGLLAAALPCPGLVRLDALADADDPLEARIIRAQALRALALDLAAKLTRAQDGAAQIAADLAGQRRSARTPALAALLAGFGAMRSAQIEAVLGATRLGVRGMLATLRDRGLVTRTAVSGVWLYSLARRNPQPAYAPEPAERLAFSREALEEFGAATAEIDRLLGPMAIDPDLSEE